MHLCHLWSISPKRLPGGSALLTVKAARPTCLLGACPANSNVSRASDSRGTVILLIDSAQW